MFDDILVNLSKELPKLADGRIDYTGSSVAVVINIFIFYNGKLLLLKRSSRVGNYKKRWNVVAGFYDELKPVEEKALEEVKEETKIQSNQIKSIKVGECFRLADQEIKKTFYIFPVLIKLYKNPRITLDWEHTNYRWIKLDELPSFDTVYGFATVAEEVMKMLD